LSNLAPEILVIYLGYDLSLRGHDGKSFVLSEVCEVLDVQRRERQLVDQVARGNPGIIGWSRSATAKREA
jgi:hypothetical protein